MRWVCVVIMWSVQTIIEQSFSYSISYSYSNLKVPVVLQRTATKCTKNYNAHAQLLFCSLTLLFGDVLVAVTVVICVRSLTSIGNSEYEARCLSSPVYRCPFYR